MKNYPTRVTTTFQGKKGQIVLDQIRTVDKNRLIKNLGSISKAAREKVLSVLQEMFEPQIPRHAGCTHKNHPMPLKDFPGFTRFHNLKFL